jgi:serine phosphatase RsbU (regulator of sigma subunit)/tetratricopeptide (TPR) repeat protein
LVSDLPAQKGNQQKKYTVADTAAIRSMIDKGTAHASNNNDSAMWYVDKAIEASLQIKNDELLANGFYLKAKVYYFISDFSAAQFYQYKSLVLAQKLGEKNLESKAYNLGGAIFYNLGKYDEALKQYNNRLKISGVLKDTASVIQAYFNITLLYNTKGYYNQAIEVAYKALEIAEKRYDTINMMALYEGLGMAYHQMSDKNKATNFLNKAYQFALIKKEEYEQGGILIDLGNIYQHEGSLSHNEGELYQSINYYNNAIEITKKNGDKRRQSTATSNKAKTYLMLKRYKDALFFNDEAMKINLEINYTKGICDAFATKAECYLETGDFQEAEKNALKSLEIANNLKSEREQHDCYILLSRVYDHKKDARNAYKYYKQAIELRDTIEGMARVKSIAELGLDYERKKIERQIKFKIAEEEANLRKQKQIRNIFLTGGIIMLIILVFVIRIYIKVRRANNEIAKQNKILGETNARIIESIDYSKSIQQSMLPPENEVKNLLPESFVLYKPKDIVSGDFYFIEPVETSRVSLVVFALADCTGHGVPGALMSLMGHSILKECLKAPEVNSPGEGLEYLDKELHSFLHQGQKEERILDGMDIAFCSMDLVTGELVYSGANNPLWIVSKRKNIKDNSGNELNVYTESNGNILYEIKATKQPIGFSEDPKKFENHILKLERGDCIYLFTDGFADQFGGPKAKKYKYKQLSEVILSSTNKTMTEQKRDLEISFEKWKGNLEQIDDVSVLGIRF